MDNNSILIQIKSLEQVIMRDFFMKVMNDDVKMKKFPSPTQMRIIDYILQNDKKPVYQKDLERVFNLRRATISEVLQTMEKNNIIERCVSEVDNRTKEIKLSKETKKIFDNNKRKFLELESIITNNISDSELEIFINVINKMKDNIQNMN